MNWFLDMCILIFYSSEDRSLASVKTLEFISKHKGGRYIVCYYVSEDNLPKWIKRQQIIVKEVIRKIKDESYVIGDSEESSFLYPKDKQKAEKLFVQFNLTSDKAAFINELQINQKKQELKLRQFIEQRAEKVIPVSEIDIELRSNLFTYTQNMSDAKTIASGIQQHNKEGLILLTGDKKDWIKENLELAVNENSKLAERYPKIPKIVHIQDT